MSAVPGCRALTIHAFGGDHRISFVRQALQTLDGQRDGTGPGLTRNESLLFTGHCGVSTEDDPTIYGFSPDPGSDPMWLVFDNLKNARAYPGVVSDDTPVFAGRPLMDSSC